MAIYCFLGLSMQHKLLSKTNQSIWGFIYFLIPFRKDLKKKIINMFFLLLMLLGRHEDTMNIFNINLEEKKHLKIFIN